MKTMFLFSFLFISFKFCAAQTNTFPSSGNVGIGTTSPSAKLDVNGDFKVNSGAIFSGAIYDTYIGQSYGNAVNFGYNANAEINGWIIIEDTRDPFSRRGEK